MNRELLELAVQAGVNPKDVEYFAELLIKKCAQVMNDEYYEEHAPYGFGADERLNKYFGFTVEHTGD